MKKIIFLDIDDVCNSYRSLIAFGGYPYVHENHDKFDQVAISLIENVCKKCNAEIVLSSTWRLVKGWEKLRDILNLPIIDKTPALLNGSRGNEISMWLRDNPIFKYVIIDDTSDMLESQLKNFVHVDCKNGFSYENYEKTLKILGVENEG